MYIAITLKKPFFTVTFITLALVALFTLGLMGWHSTTAKTGPQDTALSSQSSGIILPKTSIYALNANNAIFVLTPGATSFSRLGRVTTTNGNLIGIDFRVSDGLL